MNANIAKVDIYDMKLSLLDVLNEISRWKKEGFSHSKLFDVLNNLKHQGNFYIHFTNNPLKLSFNPTSENHKNPQGFYGFEITPDFLENPENSWTGSKYVVIFEPKSSANIIDANEDLVNKIRLHGASKIGVLLRKSGIDGIRSRNNAMSGDIKDEIVLFNDKSFNIIGTFVNTIKDDLEKEKIENNLQDISPNKIARFEKYKDGNPLNKNDFQTPKDYDRAVFDQRDAREYFKKKQAISYFNAASRKKRKLGDL